MLVESYNWDEESADEAVPDTFWESVDQSASGYEMAASDAANAAEDAADDALDVFPWWAPYAVAVLVLVAVLVALRPYASMASGVAG